MSPPNLRIEMDYPSDLKNAALWAGDLHDAFLKGSRFLEYVKTFSNRSSVDLRLQALGEEGFLYTPEGDRVYSGLYHEEDPCRKILWCGTEDERVRGMFLDPRREDDATQYSHIRPYTQTTPLPKDQQFVIPSQPVRYNYVTLEVHPAEMAWRMISESLNVGHCSHAYIVSGSDVEGVVFFFPFEWGTTENLYIAVGYRTPSDMFLFQGDPDVWALDNRRPCRTSEFDEYRRYRDAWGPHPTPVILPFTEEGMSLGEYGEPRTFSLPEYVTAASRLRQLEYRNGLPYLLSR